MQSVKAKIRDISDFPTSGVLFKDITPLMQDYGLMREAMQAMLAPYREVSITAVAGMEARGFIFGTLAAWELGVGFIPLRKPGKLPHLTHSVEYALEYGQTSLEIHQDAITPGDRILIVDDVLATGGTAKASCQLIEQLGGQVIACVFLMEILGLKGRHLLTEYDLHCLLEY